MKKSFLYILMGLAVIAAACTPEEKEKPQPKISDPSKAPQVVSTIPEANDPAANLVDEIVITYDKPVFFAPNTTISVNGVYNEDVYLLDNSLYIPVELRGGVTYTVKVASPTIKDSEGNFSGDYTLTFTTLVNNNFKDYAFSIDENPSDPDATDAAKALYGEMKENFGKKIYSATMAEVSWNYENAEAVHQMTGKYPAINAFDYIHLPSSPSDWIDYSDITPVKDWVSLGGIVAAGWHWLVPTSNPNSSLAEDLIDFDDVETGGWANSICLTQDMIDWYADAVSTLAMSIFKQCNVGSTIDVYYKDAASDAQMAFKNHGWGSIVDENGTDYGYFSIPEGSGHYTLTLDAVTLPEIKDNGIIIGGQNFTICYVIVTHPKENGAVTIDFDDVETGGWANSKCLTQDMIDWYGDEDSKVAMPVFQEAVVGTTLTFYYKDAASDAQMAFKNHNWGAIVAEDGTDYGYFSIPEGEGSYTLTLDAVTLAEIKANGIIIGGQNYTLTMVVVENPAEQADVQYAFYSNANDFNPVDAVSSGNWQNKIANADLDELVSCLKLLQDEGIPVLFRPLHEASGGWFWWGSRSGADYVTLWKYVYEYITGAGVHNLLWVWTSCLDDSDWYPGDAYVDFIAYDWYPQETELYHTSGIDNWNDLLKISNHKMLALGECGAMPSVTECLVDGSMWSWWMPWYGEHMTEPHNSAADFRAWMASSYVISATTPQAE